MAPSGKTRLIRSAVTGAEFTEAGSQALGFQKMLDFARNTGRRSGHHTEAMGVDKDKTKPPPTRRGI